MSLWPIAVIGFFALAFGNICFAASSEGQVDNPASYMPTSASEVEISNPIKLRVVKDAPSFDLPTLTGQLSLADAVNTGIKNNLTLKQSEQSWLALKFLARSALAKLGPSASFNTWYSTSSLNQMLFHPADMQILPDSVQPIVKGTSLSVMFAARQPVFTGGRLMGGYKAARAMEKQSLSMYREERTATAFKVKKAYWESAWREAQLRVAADYVKYREWSSKNMKAQVTEGKVSKADYLREEAELAKARIELNERYRDFNSALLTLKVALALNLGSQIGLTDTLEYIETVGDVGDFLLQAAKNSPEIARAASKVAEMKARRMVALSKYSPQLDVFGLSSNITGSSPDGTSAGRWGGFIGLLGGLTLFDSGGRLNEVRAANAAVREAELAQKDIELKVAQDVSLAWIDLDLARRNVNLAQGEIISAAEDNRLYHARWQVGKAIALEDFESSVKLFQARLAQLEAIYKYRVAQAKLIFASGGI